MLESLLHGQNCFITLTYSDEHLSMTSSGLPTLNPKDLQDWLKRFRKAILPLRVRYYAVGEYGDDSQRPHYHVAMFNYPVCERGNSSYTRYRSTSCCQWCDRVRDTWGLGQVYLGDLSVHSAQYVAGYVTKKMTSEKDPRLNGRYPEFARMSLRPGIGADALHDVASVLLGLEDRMADVPSALRHGSRLLPLGRYLRRRLRVLVGRDANAPQETLEQIAEELRPMWEAASVNEKIPALRSAKFKHLAMEVSDQKVRQLEARQKLFKKRGNI